MQRNYQAALAALNSRQRQAVQAIEGPVLVMAGPGTGKTQLISTRVGYILAQTDTPADAILLLTFTQAGVEAMRERLELLIGKAAYDVHLSTYHAFGGEIFRRYPDYFGGPQLNLLEELSADRLLRGIIAKLPYSDPLKFADSYLGDIKSFISEAKRALLSADDIGRAAADNLRFISTMNKSADAVLNKLSLVGKKSVPAFEDLLVHIGKYQTNEVLGDIRPLAGYAQQELNQALSDFSLSGKTRVLSEWKRRWLAKDEQGNTIFDGQRANERLASAASIYRRYQRQLRAGRLYDYDDMIIRAIETLEANPELRYSLADRYSYIMLDEFQDTNPAQFRLVSLLSDHPVHEGRPNVLAVGDDDQAIYAFQGADHANMAAFLAHYKDVKTISLRQNYRSWPALLSVSGQIAAQIDSRLTKQFSGLSKNLAAAVEKLPEPAHIEAREFKSDAAQYDWIAGQISRLISKGLPPSEIAVLAPKHRYLQPLLPYLAQYRLPVRYERRENILDERLVHQLEQMSRLVLAIADGDERQSNHLWPQVLSFDFWQQPVERIWQLNWQARQSRQPWTALLLNDEALKDVASFFIKLSTQLLVVPLEVQLDALIGLPGSATELKLPIRSPLYDYYFSKQSLASQPAEFNKLISDLNVLRARLRDWRRVDDEPLGLAALVEFIDGHRAAGLSVLNTSPYYDNREAVNILTAYGAKGREFRAVFVAAANDEVWGSASRNQGYRLSLPANLSYIRYQGASEDERLRLLYVAISRARTQLYFTSYRQDLAGRPSSRLKYLNITEEDGKLVAEILPPKHRQIIADPQESISLASAASYWQRKHLPPFQPRLREVLEPRLSTYRVSATDLNRFIDIVNHGPEDFFMRCLLRFPAAPSINDSFGTAIHNSLRFAGRILINEHQLPDEARLLEIFAAQLARDELPSDEFENLSQRGNDSLRAWLAQAAQSLKPSDRFEYDFQNEGSHAGSVPLGGRVDRLIIDEKRRAISVLDYKTGKAYSRWQPGIIKLHLFRQQLQVYKLLVESSARFGKYRVEQGIIEFIEPDENGLIRRLELSFDEEAMERTAKLISAVWDAVLTLKFPDISAYKPTLAGIRQFEDDLIWG